MNHQHEDPDQIHPFKPTLTKSNLVTNLKDTTTFERDIRTNITLMQILTKSL